MSDVDPVPVPDTGIIPKGGLYGGPYDSTALDRNIRAVLADVRWTLEYGGSQAATVISYSFPTLEEYGAGYQGEPDLATKYFAPTDAFKSSVATTLNLLSSYTNLVFVEAESGLAADSTLRFSNFNDPNTSFAFYPPYTSYDGPTPGSVAGDIFMGDNGHPPPNYFGTDDFNSVMHETGHALGLKHGHEADGSYALDPEFNDNEFSVMTYASYFGSDTQGASAAWVGSAPQSYMMFDIAALQALYGANFSKAGTTATYTWDSATGQQYINGVAAADTGVSATFKIFSTVWTGGALTTYDLSNFDEDQVDDLRAGRWLTFARDKIADLNNMAPEGTPEYQAQGNIYNSLLYQGDTRSLISNLITGEGNDTIIGNELSNTLIANGGDDVIDGGDGDDLISGGAGADTITFGNGNSVLRDLVADLNGDLVMDLGRANSVDIQGLFASRADFVFTVDTAATTVGIAGSAFELRGTFADGDFMTVARGVGTEAQTSLSFVDFLPTLQEGVAVDLDLINGLANAPFLTGDGQVGYSVVFESAVSAYHNMVGAYTISVDGTISDVQMLFTNTLSATSGLTVDLDTPAAGEQIGFFLIQDGYDVFGALPDDLAFVAADGGAADLTGGAPLLYSASRGFLSGAEIFFSHADFNDGGYQQVLSGVSADGLGLRIGFEDLSQDIGDNDYQDVVFTVLDNSALFVV
ncbi:MAG: DUF4114 domain-containing protein [Pseudomonadota bacterium]